MWVAEPLLDAYRVGGHHALSVVHGGKAVAVVTQCVVDILVVVGREIREKVVGVGFVPVDGDL